jgi:hypothetical protein
LFTSVLQRIASHDGVSHAIVTVRVFYSGSFTVAFPAGGNSRSAQWPSVARLCLPKIAVDRRVSPWPNMAAFFPMYFSDVPLSERTFSVSYHDMLS